MAVNPAFLNNLTSVASTTGQVAATSNNSDLARVGSGLASGAATGAAIGSIVPGLGTAIGGAVGAIVGGLAGLLGGKSKSKPLSEADLEVQVKFVLSGSGRGVLMEGVVPKALGYIDNQIGKSLHDDIISSLGLTRLSIKKDRKSGEKYAETMFGLIKEAKAYNAQQQQSQVQAQLPPPVTTPDVKPTQPKAEPLPTPNSVTTNFTDGLPSLEEILTGGFDGILDTLTGSEKGKEVQQTVVKNWFADNWSKITTGAMALGIVVFALVKSFSKKSKRR